MEDEARTAERVDIRRYAIRAMLLQPKSAHGGNLIEDENGPGAALGKTGPTLLGLRREKVANSAGPETLP